MLFNKFKYGVKKIVENYRDYNWWMNVYNNNIIHKLISNKGFYILEEDWDVLIILDACRYDTFKKYNNIEGKLEYRISRGSETTEFLNENFNKKYRNVDLQDIIYLAANPFVSRYLKNRFFMIDPIWNYGWDKDVNTVLPNKVCEKGLKLIEQYRDKKIIMHFMQPHEPFINYNFKGASGFSNLRKSILKDDVIEIDVLWEDLLKNNKINIRQVIEAYENNLIIVLKYIKEMVTEIKSKVVITSDHGNMFGERTSLYFPFKIYGHPDGIYTAYLRKVPWFIIDNKNI